MILQWTLDLSVSNDKIDKEHRYWIELFNGFYKGIAEGKPKEKLEVLILGMLEYTKFHFSSEEEFMRSLNYAELSEHKAKHDFFIMKIEEFYDKLSNGRMIVSLEVTNFLKAWLVNHIKGVDMQYAQYAMKLEQK